MENRQTGRLVVVVMTRLVRLMDSLDWFGWNCWNWFVFVYWPAGAFGGCCLFLVRPIGDKIQEKHQQEFLQPLERQAIFEIVIPSQEDDDSTLDLQKVDGEDCLPDQLATSQNLYRSSSESSVGQWQHSLLLEFHRLPFSEHTLEGDPFVYLSNMGLVFMISVMFDNR